MERQEDRVWSNFEVFVLTVDSAGTTKYHSITENRERKAEPKNLLHLRIERHEGRVRGDWGREKIPWVTAQPRGRVAGPRKEVACDQDLHQR